MQTHIDLVKPTVQFEHRPPAPPMRKREVSSSWFRGPKTTGAKVAIPPSLSNCSNAITPACLQALYNIDYTPVATEKNTFGIGMFSSTYILVYFLNEYPPVELTPQAYLQSDLGENQW